MLPCFKEEEYINYFDLLVPTQLKYPAGGGGGLICLFLFKELLGNISSLVHEFLNIFFQNVGRKKESSSHTSHLIRLHSLRTRTSSRDDGWSVSWEMTRHSQELFEKITIKAASHFRDFRDFDAFFFNQKIRVKILCEWMKSPRTQIHFLRCRKKRRNFGQGNLHIVAVNEI